MRNPLIAAVVAASAMASLIAPMSASAQSIAPSTDLVYLGRSSTTIVMISAAPAAPPTGLTDVWVWHFFGPSHDRSSSRGPYSRAVRQTIDCVQRSSRSAVVEHFAGSTFETRNFLGDAATWGRPADGTLGAVPIAYVCDPRPATPRPVFDTLQRARDGADTLLTLRSGSAS